MTSSAQLEREAEQTRSQLAQRLDELRERITPGQLVDEAVDYAKDSGGGVFVRNLGRQATANPLPVALIGAGIAWLMLSNGRHSANAASINRAAETAIDEARQSMAYAGEQIGELGDKANAQAREIGNEASNRVSDWVADTKGRITNARERLADGGDTTRRTAEDSGQEAISRAGQAANSLRENASSAFETAKSRASETYERVAGQAKQASSTTAHAVAGLGQRTTAASRDLLQFCKTQPLVIAGLGMALGAILGALIPPTETEDNLMGETSDQLKDQAREVAEDQIERTKSAAKSGFKQAEAQFNFEGTGGKSDVPAETTLVPEAASSDEPAEQQG
jgi:F0F1-type ATP synthase membrane subunit b/b'